MSYSIIDKPTDYFNTKLYTGNFSNNHSITGVGFKPDLVWTKNRTDGGEWHSWFDVIRGVTKRIYSNETNAEETASNSLISFDSDGFTLNADNNVNKSGKNFASWNWLGANGTASNSNGSITSTVSANTTAGFSIVSYTGNGTSGATIGHGLGVKPSCMIIKRTSAAANWAIYHNRLNSGTNPEVKYLEFNTNGELDDAGIFNDTAPTSSVFTVGNSDKSNISNSTYIAYCFAEKQGYSKFGSYVGNGNADGSFIYTGFKPAFVMVKKSSASGSDWNLHDNKRPGFNVNNSYLAPNENAAEVTGNTYQIFDLLSNGFKCRGAGTGTNASGETMIYMAFAESPFVGNNFVPNNAR